MKFEGNISVNGENLILIYKPKSIISESSYIPKYPEEWKVISWNIITVEDKLINEYDAKSIIKGTERDHYKYRRYKATIYQDGNEVNIKLYNIKDKVNIREG